MNIENFKGNPKLEILYPLIRMLNIDAQEVFYPELQQESPHLRQLMQLMSDCSDQEAETLIPIIQTILTALRSKEYLQIK
jgi:DNA-binding XRE family transcriptional regulator